MAHKAKGAIQCRFCKKWPDLNVFDAGLGETRIGFACSCSNYSRVYDESLCRSENIRAAAEGWNKMQRAEISVDTPRMGREMWE